MSRFCQHTYREIALKHSSALLCICFNKLKHGAREIKQASTMEGLGNVEWLTNTEKMNKWTKQWIFSDVPGRDKGQRTGRYLPDVVKQVC